jgi:hypothetical protein
MLVIGIEVLVMLVIGIEVFVMLVKLETGTEVFVYYCWHKAD